MKFRAVTYNMHKGRSFWFRSYKINKIRGLISGLSPDILFLQEINGVHPKRYASLNSPLDEIAENFLPYYCYGRNAVYQNGHHGNAVLSRYEILNYQNNDISQSRFASRGLLHAQVRLYNNAAPLHILNVHLDLFESARQKQVAQIQSYLYEKIPQEESVILAGDFNDIRRRLDSTLLQHFTKALHPNRKLATFPSSFPYYDLDRIYYRNLNHVRASVPPSMNWRTLSDHLPLIVDFDL